MIELSVTGLEKEFEVGKKILDGVTFQVDTGERVGLLGKNGAGKTTLFRILTGEVLPDSGEVSIAGGKRLGLISQIPRYPVDYTVEDVLTTAFARLHDMERELARLTQRMAAGEEQAIKRYGDLSAVFEGAGGYDTATQCNKVCSGLGISDAMRKQAFDSLSGGEKTRVNLARLILEDTDILLLDEPTNHLDLRATEWLEEYLRRFRGTVLTISHDRWFLDETVDRIIELQDGKAEFYAGNYSFFVEEKEARYQERLKQYEKEQAKIRQLEKAAEQLRVWAYSGMDKTFRRARSMEKRIDRLRTTERPTRERAMSVRFDEREFRGDELFSVKGLKKTYDGRTLFSNVGLEVTGGERIALLGDNGTGKTTFLKILLGEETPDEGRIRFGPAAKLGYLPQVVRFDHPERTLVDTLIYELDCSTQSARDRLAQFKFRGEDVFKQVSALSGGEQSRLRLCMLMDGALNLLILDEPTNHLDLASREWMEEAVEDYGGGLLFVSHDRYFIHRFATRIWMLEDGRITDFRGNYQEFQAFRAKKESSRPVSEPEPEPKKEKPKRTGGTKQLEKETAAAERAVSRAEEKIYELTLEMEENGANYLKLQELHEERTALEEELAHLYTVWETLAAELEEVREG